MGHPQGTEEAQRGHLRKGTEEASQMRGHLSWGQDEQRKDGLMRGCKVVGKSWRESQLCSEN